jgi:hypothetical protein
VSWAPTGAHGHHLRSATETGRQSSLRTWPPNHGSLDLPIPAVFIETTKTAHNRGGPGGGVQDLSLEPEPSLRRFGHLPAQERSSLETGPPHLGDPLGGQTRAPPVRRVRPRARSKYARMARQSPGMGILSASLPHSEARVHRSAGNDPRNGAAAAARAVVARGAEAPVDGRQGPSLPAVPDDHPQHHAQDGQGSEGQPQSQDPCCQEGSPQAAAQALRTTQELPNRLPDHLPVGARHPRRYPVLLQEGCRAPPLGLPSGERKS